MTSISRKTLNSLILVSLSACAVGNVDHSPPFKSNLAEERGVFISGEFSLFKSSSGNVFTLRTRSERERAVFNRLTPLTIDAEDVCLSMVIRGTRSHEFDSNHREVFDVTKIVTAQKIKCPE